MTDDELDEFLADLGKKLLDKLDEAIDVPARLADLHKRIEAEQEEES